MLAVLVPIARAADCDPLAEACEEIVVAASRTEEARADTIAPIAVIDREEIERSGAATVTDVLRTVPGLDIAPTFGGNGLRMQGLDPAHTLVLVDGRPLAGRVDGTVDLDRLRLDDVERIEIVSGPASALFGSDALGGVVDIVTRRSTDGPNVDAVLRAGSRRLAEGDASVDVGRDALAGGVTGDLQTHDAFDRDPSDEATSGDALSAYGGRGWIRAKPSRAWTLDGDAAYRRRDLEGIDATTTGAVFDRRTLEESLDAGAAAALRPGGPHATRVELATSVWRQQYLSDQRGSDVQDAYEETLDRRGFLFASHRAIVHRHVLVVGADATAEELRSDRLDGGVADRQRIALYAQDDAGIRDDAPRVSASLGGRVDLDTQFGVHPTPHAALRIDPFPTLSWRSSAGGGFRAPDFKELHLVLDHGSYGYVVEGNPALDPESSIGITTELAWTPDGPVSLSASGWWTEVRALIDVDLVTEGTASAPALYTYVNVARVRTRGGVASAGLDLDRIALHAAATLTDARDRDTGVLLDGRPRTQVSASVDVEPIEPVVLTARATRVGPRPFTTDDGTTWTDPYVWIDGRAAWTVRKGFELEAGVRNALDARDDETLGLEPRTFFLGLRASGRPSPQGE
jgi:outer membrane receptor for ferrienterochelin and colicins